MKFYVLLKEKGFEFTADGENYAEFVYNKLLVIQNLSLTQFILDEQNHHSLINFAKKELLKSGLFSKFIKFDIVLVTPSDTTLAEIELFSKFFLKTIARSVLHVFECTLAINSDSPYIFLSKTNKSFILSYISENKILRENFIEKKLYTNEEMLINVNEVCFNYCYLKIPVYLYGFGDAYDIFGDSINHKQLMKNLISNLNKKSSQYLSEYGKVLDC